jgi:hypothetical protein
MMDESIIKKYTNISTNIFSLLNRNVNINKPEYLEKEEIKKMEKKEEMEEPDFNKDDFYLYEISDVDTIDDVNIVIRKDREEDREENKYFFYIIDDEANAYNGEVNEKLKRYYDLINDLNTFEDLRPNKFYYKKNFDKELSTFFGWKMENGEFDIVDYSTLLYGVIYPIVQDGEPTYAPSDVEDDTSGRYWRPKNNTSNYDD